MKVVRVEANVRWRCQRANRNWIGVCDPLKLTVQSETYAELMEDIGLTLNAVLRDLLKSNELPQFLSEQGWETVDPIPSPKLKNVRFDVPFVPEVMKRTSYGSEANRSEANVH